MLTVGHGKGAGRCTEPVMRRRCAVRDGSQQGLPSLVANRRVDDDRTMPTLATLLPERFVLPPRCREPVPPSLQ